MQQGTAILEFLKKCSEDTTNNMQSILDISERRGYKNTAYNSTLDVLMSSNKSQSDIIELLIEMEENVINKS